MVLKNIFKARSCFLFPKIFLNLKRVVIAGTFLTLCLAAVGCDESTGGGGRGAGSASLQQERVAPPSAPVKAELPEWQKDILVKMETTRVSFDFAETPLRDVVATLRNKTGFNIVMWGTVDENAPVTLKLNDVKLRNAMDWVMRTQGLEYKLVDEALVIARKEDLKSKPVTAVYDVRDLGYSPPNFIPPGPTEADNPGHEEQTRDAASSAEALQKVVDSIIDTAEKAAEDEKAAARQR